MINCALLACMLCGFALLPGCLVAGNNKVTYGPGGRMVSEDTLAQIEPGKTTETQLVAMLGEPTRKSDTDETTQLYTYEYSRKTNTQVTVFLLMAINDSSEHCDRLYFEIADGIVQNYWKDKAI